MVRITGYAAALAALITFMLAGAAHGAVTANNDSYSMSEDTVLYGTSVVTNDVNPIGTQKSAVLNTPPTQGDVRLNLDGTFVYMPDPNDNGPATFTYVVHDGFAFSSPATVTITINAVNDPPRTFPESYNTATNTQLNVSAPGVLGNDLDVDGGNGLFAELAQGPTVGSLSLSSGGSFTYTPAPGDIGARSFSYRASDGITDGPAVKVTILVGTNNFAPTGNPDSASTPEDTPLTVNAPGVRSNDTDPAGGTIDFAYLVSYPSVGQLNFLVTGGYTYDPPPNFNGNVTFQYRSVDNASGLTAAQTVTITVTASNDGPLVADNRYSTNEDTTLTVTAAAGAPGNGVLNNDFDPEGTTLTAAKISNPAHGTASIGPTGGVVYTPAANYNGPDAFTYQSSDGFIENTATVHLTVIAVNDAPVGVADSMSCVEDTPCNGNVLSNDTDLESGGGANLSAVLVAQPAAGTGTVSLSSNGAFTYTPPGGYFGSTSFTYRARDPELAQSSITTVTLTVASVNDAPVAADDSYAMSEDVPLVVSAANGVLANDSDPDNNSMTAQLVAPPGVGTLSLAGNGGFTYTAPANYAGSASFTYRAVDSIGAQSAVRTVSITVNAVNDAPVGASDAYQVAEDAVLNVAVAQGVLNNDSDVEGQALNALLVTEPVHGDLLLNSNGSFTYTPAANYNGADSFTYRPRDTLNAAGAPTTVNLTVTSVNDTPVAVGNTYAATEDTPLVIAVGQGVLGNDTDDGVLTALQQTTPTFGTAQLNENGSFTYTPDANFTGTDSFLYRARDATGAESLAVLVVLEVANVNDAPFATPDENKTVAEDGVLTVPAPGVLANDGDLEEQPLSAVNASDPEHGTVKLESNGAWVYTPDPNYNGQDTFTYEASDGSLSSSPARVFINVTPVDEPVVVVPPPPPVPSVTPTPGGSDVIAGELDAGDIVTIPRRRSCAAGAKLKLSINIPDDLDLAKLVVEINGKTKKTITSKFPSRLTLTRLPKRRTRITVELTTKDGEEDDVTRSFKACPRT